MNIDNIGYLTFKKEFLFPNNLKRHNSNDINSKLSKNNFEYYDMNDEIYKMKNYNGKISLYSNKVCYYI